MSHSILVDITSQNFILFCGVLARTLAACFLFPGFSEPFLPMRYRLIFGIGIALVIYPIFGSNSEFQYMQSAVYLICTETVIGLFFGAIVRTAIYAKRLRLQLSKISRSRPS